ncbi:MAG TPA: nuclear transport factor 2 family protein [Candidatus Dormibacteraeota bacterium]
MAETGTKLTAAQKIEKARKALDDLNRREVDPETYSPDAEFHGFLLGELKGRDAIVSGLKKMSQTDDFRGLETHDVLANDEHVIALITLKARRNGEDVDARQALIIHANDQGQITEQWVFPDPASLKQLGR